MPEDFEATTLTPTNVFLLIFYACDIFDKLAWTDATRAHFRVGRSLGAGEKRGFLGMFRRFCVLLLLFKSFGQICVATYIYGSRCWLCVASICRRCSSVYCRPYLIQGYTFDTGRTSERLTDLSY